MLPAEEDAKAGLIPNLTKERFMSRPGLVTDELLGMTIANYVAGAKGILSSFASTKISQVLSKTGADNK